MVDPIKIDGLSEFSRNLKKLDSELPKMLRLALNESADLVAGRARPLIPTGPNKGGHASSSVKAQSTRTESRVSGGGNRYPYYPWLDFGGSVGPKRSIRRPFIKEGRYIYGSYYELYGSGKFQEAMVTALLKVAREAGVEVD